jgi:hypothetical protein
MDSASAPINREMDKDTMELYSAIKKKKMMLAGESMEQVILVLCEISQSHKDEDCVFSLICES